MREEFQYSVVSKIMRDFDETFIMNWLDQVKLEGLNEYVLYRSAHSVGKIKVLAKLNEKKTASNFVFVSDLKDLWISSGDIDKLEYPQINTKNSFFAQLCFRPQECAGAKSLKWQNLPTL